MVTRGLNGVPGESGPAPVGGLSPSSVPQLTGAADLATGSVTVEPGAFVNSFDDLDGDSICVLGEVRNGTPDSLLRGVKANGIEHLEKAAGSGVVAIWDGTAGELTLSRYPGVHQPVYWRRDGDAIRFATRLRSLLSSKDRWDPATAVQFLRSGTIYSPRTMVSGVRRIPPHEALSFSTRDTEMTSLWEPWNLEMADLPMDERVEWLERRLGTLLPPLLETDDHPAILMSGGIDSAGLAAAIMRHHPDTRLTAYTLTFEGEHGIIDEYEEADAVARALGIEHRPIPYSHRHISDHLEWMIDIDEEPFGYGLHTSNLSPVAEGGHRVVFSGTGPDVHYPTRAHHKWRRVTEMIPENAHQAVTRALSPFSSVRGIKGLHAAFKQGIPTAEERLATRGGPTCDRSELIRIGIDPELIDATAAEGASFVRPKLNGVSPKTKRAQLSLGWAIWNLWDHGAAWMSRWQTAYGLTPAFPLTDPAIARFLASLEPLEPGRREFRELAARTLPRPLAYNRKVGQDIPLAAWLRGPLSDLAGDVVSAAGVLEGLVDPKAVKDLFEEHLRGDEDHHWFLWKLISLIAWKTSFDRKRTGQGGD